MHNEVIIMMIHSCTLVVALEGEWKVLRCCADECDALHVFTESWSPN